MCSRSLSVILPLFALLASPELIFAAPPPLRVCADPANLPFSGIRGNGFENRLARMVATFLDRDVEFVWQRMGRGFVREYMDSGKCDVVMGIPTAFRSLLTTQAYYRSSYVFLTRHSASFQPASLDDPRLKQFRIGVEALQDEYTPPAEALSRRGLQSQLVGIYSVGSHSMDLARAVSRGEVDFAIMWGPMAGYAAIQAPKSFVLKPMQPESDGSLPFTFAISMGVRKGDLALQSQLNAFINAHRVDIAKLLDRYGVPELPLNEASIRVKQ